ncbi:MAG: S8 family serine peptidase [Candidatus Omnitrophica bacterium]|nr:S8 family serine peptidase [Candidatus Omnitrophota bacterium]
MLPSYDKRIIRVGAVKSNGERAEESNYGVTLEGFRVANLYAPGRLHVKYPDAGKDIVMGSSFSSPVVGAVAGLLFWMDLKDSMNGLKISEILEETSRHHGKDSLPVVDVEAAVTKAAGIIVGKEDLGISDIEIPDSIAILLKTQNQAEKTVNTSL